VTSTTSPTISVVTPATTEGAPPPSSTTTVTTEPEVLIPLADIDLDVELVADGFRQPILAIARAGDDRLFIVDQPGVVYALDLVSASTTVVLDIADAVRFSGEQGLLGIAFDPADADRMIAHYSARDGSTTIVEYRLDDAGVADPGSRREILTVDQPATNHNGGMIAFGPEGLLFIGLGDGGGANDQFDNGQDPTTLLGTILRLDLDAGDPYGIPADNPFADGVGGAPEVWAWGLRNPWRFSFDGCRSVGSRRRTGCLGGDRSARRHPTRHQRRLAVAGGKPLFSLRAVRSRSVCRPDIRVLPRRWPVFGDRRSRLSGFGDSGVGGHLPVW
jgi:glucose/arabinose dehydrogenase